MKFILLLICLTLFSTQPIWAKGKTNEGHQVFADYFQWKNILASNPELVIDHVTDESFEIYGPAGTAEYLHALGLSFYPLEPLFDFAGYPSSAQIEAQLKAMADEAPEIVRLFSVGKSVQGKELWMVKISDRPTIDEIEPEVKYIANMHGDEIVGRELMVRLIRQLIDDYRAGVPAITKLVNSTEIYIMPSMNPDGADQRSRGNGNWTDLNRDFPDFTTNDNRNTWSNREPETQAIMKFQSQRNFALSANFHGGAVVVNYPWDTTSAKHPLEGLVVDFSLQYASLVAEMRNSTRFPRGIVNGHRWYEVNGGMQDWSYYWHRDLQVTVELSQSKWPAYSTIENYYRSHKDSLVRYLQAVHQGVGFYSENSLIRSIAIRKLGGDLLISEELHAKEFYQVLPQGEYQITLTTDRGKTYQFNKKVGGGYFRVE